MMRKERNDIIGKKIKDNLKAFGMSVKELSQKTEIEVHTLYSIMNGHHQASMEKLDAICKTLHISMDALLDLEVNTFPHYARKYEESLSYAEFEDTWFGPRGGERISVSRNLSVANQSEVLRKNMLKNIYRYPDDKLDAAMKAFRKRQQIIKEKEKRRLEIVVESEVIDFIQQRKPFDLLEKELIIQTIEGVVKRLEDEPLNFEVVLIPRQFFLVNYEIINREVILFDLGSVFFRQTHQSILNHFLREVEDFKFRLSAISERDAVINFFKEQLNAVR
jgi:transcriptional regulator with XRE-family HTH domain